MEGRLANASLSVTIGENSYTRDEAGGYRIYSEVDDDILTDDDADGEPDPEYAGSYNWRNEASDLESDSACEGVPNLLYARATAYQNYICTVELD